MPNIEVTQVATAKAAVHPSLRRTAAPRKKRTLEERIIADLVKDGLLPFRFKLQLPYAIALAKFLRDVHAAWGTSGALGSIDLDRTRGAGPVLGQPGTATHAMEAANRVIECLARHELDLLKWLVQARERSQVMLATLGREWCGIEEENRAQGAATGVLQMLARSIAAAYPHDKVWTEPAKISHARRAAKMLEELAKSRDEKTIDAMRQRHADYKRRRVP